MEGDKNALEEYKTSLKQVENSIADLERSYLDPSCTIGIVLRGWPKGDLKVKEIGKDFEGKEVKKIFSKGNYNSQS